jgi:hypothetical protein
MCLNKYAFGNCLPNCWSLWVLCIMEKVVCRHICELQIIMCYPLCNSHDLNKDPSGHCRLRWSHCWGASWRSAQRGATSCWEGGACPLPPCMELSLWPPPSPPTCWYTRCALSLAGEGDERGREKLREWERVYVWITGVGVWIR